MENKRLFTAIRFPDETIKQIAEIQNKLKELDPKARFVNPITNFHITLYYIGNTTDLIKVEDSFKESCNKYLKELNHSIPINFSRLGFFKNRSGNILWLGVENNEYLDSLAYFIPETLKENGFDVSIKKYKPHITLARNYRGDLPENFILPNSISIDQAALVWSHKNVNNVLTYDNLLFSNLIKED